MKSLIAAAVALFGLGGCIAVPAPYGPYGPDVYYSAPAVGVAVYPGYGYYRGHGHGRNYRGHGRRY